MTILFSFLVVMVPDDNLTNENRHLSEDTIQHIAKYPFAHSEREVYEYFLRQHSSFVLREVRLYFEDIDCIFCSLECASHFNREHYGSNLFNICFDAFHLMFKDISVLQTYSERRRCMVCQKYTTVCDDQNLYAEPSGDYVFQVYLMYNYPDDLLQSTVHA